MYTEAVGLERANRLPWQPHISLPHSQQGEFLVFHFPKQVATTVALAAVW